MNQEFMENNKDWELVGVDSVIDSLSTLIEQGSEKIVAFISSDDFSDLLVEIKELGAELSKAIKVVKIIRKSCNYGTWTSP